MGIVGNNIRTNENRFLIPPIVIDMEKDEIYRSPSYFCAATSAAIGATGQRGNSNGPQIKGISYHQVKRGNEILYK